MQPIRIQKALSEAGVASRRAAEEDEKPGSQGESVGLRLAEEKRKE